SSIQIVESPLPHLLLQTDRADLVFAELPKLAIQERIRIQEVSSPDDNLESVFDFLVNAGSPGGKASA
ncbi:MAG: hypothetical protein KDB53_03275, partial [Planctomycetes bacterium]|nr:hypothetical protein [Planctomycetota bacterium]